MNENQKKFMALMEDDEKIRELFSQEDAAAAQKWLAAQGIELSIEELNTFRAKLLAKMEDNEEMDEDQLEQVAGGSVESWLDQHNFDGPLARAWKWKNEHITKPIHNFFRRW
ncbi:MAG: ComC/BlpC family leader-containing pheromone/bacteriocin [Selenomonadaceae bacterium]|nr:ComC/BlpC family leader-containing pheromone/bacteriocin [Selenomonadaceae bacterium]